MPQKRRLSFQEIDCLHNHHSSLRTGMEKINKDRELEEAMVNKRNHESTRKFQRGDHVFQWCSFAGIPRAFQHHGIVMHVEVLPGAKDGEMIDQLTIADFSNFLPASAATEDDQDDQEESENETMSASGSLVGGGVSTGGILRVYTTTIHDIKTTPVLGTRSNTMLPAGKPFSNAVEPALPLLQRIHRKWSCIGLTFSFAISLPDNPTTPSNLPSCPSIMSCSPTASQ